MASSASVAVAGETLLDAMREDCRRAKAELESVLRDVDDFLDPLKVSEDEVHARVFNRWDINGDGEIDIAEMSAMLLSNNPSRGVYEAMTAALVTVLRYDTNEDCTIDRGEMKAIVCALADEMGENVRRAASILTMAPYSLKMSEYIEKYGRSLSTHAAIDLRDDAHDARMRELFVLFDEDLDNSIEFSELVKGLMKLKLPLPEAKMTAVQALLMCDAEAERKLDYECFANFIVQFCIVAGFFFHEVADALVYCAAGNEPEPSVATALRELEDGGVIATALDRRLHTAFSLFDEDGDDAISFAELLKVMRTFEPTVSRSLVEAGAVEGFATFDEDKDLKLDRIEFAAWLTSFCEKTTASMDEVLEYLLVAASLGKHAESVYPTSSDRWWASGPPSTRQQLAAVTEEEVADAAAE